MLSVAVSTHFIEENYKWTSERRKMLCVGIDAEPDGVRGLQSSNSTWETECLEADIMLGEEGFFAWFCCILLFLPPDPFTLILAYFSLRQKKSVSWMQDLSEKKYKKKISVVLTIPPLTHVTQNSPFSEARCWHQSQIQHGHIPINQSFLLRRKIHFSVV